MSGESPPPWRWFHIVGLVFFFWQAAAMLQAARPHTILYPAPPGDSGLTALARLESATLTTSAGPGLLGDYIYFAGVQQQWNTFAPVPPLKYSHHKIVADFGSQTSLVWDDGLSLERSGVGRYYDPIVKLVGLLRDTALQELLLRWQARRLLELGLRPRSLTLEVDYVKMRIADNGELLKSPSQSLRLRTLWLAAP